ncbi:hypothetical protein OH146_10865 [Salinibacterium sp. SYSU T00001]|uniref:hypothetical protein n=1 Tax=Homoserinimonas sedimenticola TaxID=2986805 RepID=UPI00223613A4|nr:hypothetical protein [Salinibacterium sedimenticola]MCW4386273.1 hypothetical protein [Salinibacterium sedimenticola]
MPSLEPATPAATPQASAAASASRPFRLADLFGQMELVIVILLGLVSTVTAYASFQAALYDSQMAAAYSKGQTASTEAESLYLEANQQYVQDVQLWATLTQLSIDMDSQDPSIAEAASIKFDTMYFQSVGEALDAAVLWSADENAANPESYASPFDHDAYTEALFTPYTEAKDAADAAIAQGDQYNSYSDRLTLNTVLMAVSLFLLGVAAVVKSTRSQLTLTAIATIVFLVAGGLTLAIPFVGL